MSNIIDSIQLSGTVYQIQGSGGGVPESVFTAYTASTDSRIGEDEEVTAAALNALDEKIDSISGGGNPTVEVTQAEYDAMVSAGTVRSRARRRVLRGMVRASLLRSRLRHADRRADDAGRRQRA